MIFPIKSISDLENLSQKVKWQYFEKLVAFVFEENGFDVQLGKIIKTSKGKRPQGNTPGPCTRNGYAPCATAGISTK